MNKTTYNLFSCLWELTLKCNLHCMHCGSVAGASRKAELTFKEATRVAREIIDLGCKELTFIGGEIFLYTDWEKIAHLLTSNGVTVNLMSNGYRMSEIQISQIKYAGLSNVGISVDGTKEIHNLIRGKNDSFSEIVNTFNLLNTAKIPIGVVTSLMELNYPFLNEMYQFFKEKNVNLWQIQLVNPMGNMAKKREHILKPERIPQLINFIKDKNMERDMSVIAADNVGYFYKNTETYIRGTRYSLCYWSGCMAGINSLFIDSVGNIKGCGALYDSAFIEDNIKEKSLAEIWNNPNNFSYNRSFSSKQLTGKCSECKVGSDCKGGCRASNYFVTGSLYENAYCPHRQKSNRKEYTKLVATTAI